MKKQHHNILGSLLFIILLAACGSGAPATSDPVPTLVPPLVLETVVPTAVPTPTVTETDVVAETPPTTPTLIPEPTIEPAAATTEPETTSLTADNNYGEPDVTSYRLTLWFESTLTGADGTITSGSIRIEGVRDVVNNASTFMATATGTADFGAGQQFSFTQVDETTYFILPNGDCFATGGNSPNSDLFAVFVSDGGILGNVEGAQPGMPFTETVNGILTNHYVFDETNLNPADPTTPDVTAVTGDIYLAATDNYVVRIVMQGQGSSTLLNSVDGDGEIAYELNYFDFDAPVTIASPEGCSELPTGNN